MKPAHKKAGGLAAMLFLAAPVVVSFEGLRHKAYKDAGAGIVTICVGHTGAGVHLGQIATDGQCGEMLDADLAKHASGAADCTPGLSGRPYQWAAATSFAFNVGVGAYCRSSIAREFRAGHWRQGCGALGKYIFAGGRKLPGLVRRRAAETKLCLRGLQ